MELQLRLQQKVETEDQRHVYAKGWKYEAEVVGEPVEYVLAPMNLLDKHGEGTKLGYFDSEVSTVFVDRTMNPAVVPFAAFFARYKDHDSVELQRKFGESSALEDMSSREVKNLVMAMTLRSARDYLRPKEMAELINRMKKEPEYVAEDSEHIFEKVVDKHYSLTGRSQSLTVLSDRQATVLDHYSELLGDALVAHGKHKHTRLSKLAMNTGGEFGDFMKDMYMVRSEPTAAAILEDARYTGSLIGVMDYLEGFTDLPTGTTMAITKEEGALLYKCSGDFVHGNPPIEFTGDVEIVEEIVDGKKTDVAHEIIKFRKHHSRFWPSLVKRLQVYLHKECNEAAVYLEQAQVIQKEISGNKKSLGELADSVREFLPAAEISDPKQVEGITEQVVDTLEDHVSTLQEGFTRAPERSRTLRKLSRAYALMADVEGLEEVRGVLEGRLGSLVREDHLYLQKAIGAGNAQLSLP